MISERELQREVEEQIGLGIAVFVTEGEDVVTVHVYGHLRPYERPMLMEILGQFGYPESKVEVERPLRDATLMRVQK